MQIVGYAPDPEPAILLAEEGAIERRELTPGTELSLPLGDRRCAGAVTDDGHVACDREAAPRCSAHTEAWACARCTGDCGKPLDACDRTHVVYLALFAPDVVKVGVTREGRLERRLREQGADRGAHLRTVSDGRIARQVEASLAADRTDRVRVRTKIAGFGRRVDADEWAAALAEFDPIDTFAFDYGIGTERGVVPATLATGTVRGTKGRVLVLDRDGTTYGVDLRDLVGREISESGSDRPRQASLDAY